MLLCWTGLSATLADPINYGDLIGDEVSYLQITENSTTDPFPPEATPEEVTGLYGTPVMLDDTLLFNVPSFAAQAVGGPEVDLTDGFLTFAMAARDDMLIIELFIEEFGSLNLLSPLGGTNLTNAGIVAPVFVDVQEVVFDDGTPAGRRVMLDEPVTITGISLEVTPAPNSAPVFGFASDPNVVSWLAAKEIDLVAELLATSPGIDDVNPVRGITRLQFSMNNTLSASAEDQFATAFVDKKQLSINPRVIVNVPEPAGWLVLLGGLSSCCCRWQRR